MEVSYKRSMSCNYIILQGSEGEALKTYQTRILLENQMPGLLPCKHQKIDGKEHFYYEITGCQTLYHLFENRKFSRKNLETLFLAVVRMMESLDQYLMSRDCLLLNPAYIYQNLDTEDYLFMWFPLGEECADKEFQNLTEYILPRIDHQDEAAVTMGYSVYKEAVEIGLKTERIKEHIYGGMQEKKESRKEDSGDREDTQKEWERQKILDNFYNDEEEAEDRFSLKEKIFAGTGLTLILALFFLLRNVTGISIGKICLVVAVFIAILGGGAGIWYFLESRRKEGRGWDKSYKNIGTEEDEEEGEEETEGRESGEFIPVVQPDYEEVGKTVVLYGEKESMPYLRQADTEYGRQYFLQKEVNLIGKKRECVDIWLNIPTVSRIHAKIVRKAEGDFLVDLNSRNGTLLNGRYLNPEEEYLLEDGSTLVFAESRLVYCGS